MCTKRGVAPVIAHKHHIGRLRNQISWKNVLLCTAAAADDVDGGGNCAAGGSDRECV